MKLCKKCKETKNVTEFSKDKDKKDNLCSQCKACRKIYAASYYIENRERILEYIKEYGLVNADKISTRNAEYYLENKKEIIQKVKQHIEKNKRVNLEKKSLNIEDPPIDKRCCDCKSIKKSNEFYRDISRLDGLSSICKSCTMIRILKWEKDNPEKCNKNNAKYRKKYPDRHNARQMKRRSKKLQRTPPWLTKEQFKQIEEFYTLAKELQWLSEEKLEVDHVIPLQGKNVCGLHVPWNLQILPASINRSKSNKF